MMDTNGVQSYTDKESAFGRVGNQPDVQTIEARLVNWTRVVTYIVGE
jgi:hypothetical protein